MIHFNVGDHVLWIWDGVLSHALKGTITSFTAPNEYGVFLENKGFSVLAFGHELTLDKIGG